MIAAFVAGTAGATTPHDNPPPPTTPPPTTTPPPPSPAGIQITLREFEKYYELAPGQDGFIAVVCLPGEMVINGQLTAIPASIEITSSYFFWDGKGSGWAVEFRNATDATIYITPRVGALCTPATVTAADVLHG